MGGAIWPSFNDCKKVHSGRLKASNMSPGDCGRKHPSDKFTDYFPLPFVKPNNTMKYSTPMNSPMTNSKSGTRTHT